ncbi:hypothetical protein SAMN05192558_107248 [Actinokineospora alba]|uniref:Uncharacterized protein n=1 Tax=Actinokineospora alba TaxID=504798 RepID=A0A1H0R167_9PSEU|nr:hypothetical protein C8E96_5898 [Actinokineospora alba]SDI34774.1 hypothetical protein SAMN05421871_104247 [Actinokineospora alba]SDP23302.1 hypothetical protein SAMN05192558_107248 [Actinokineospora alba]
MRTGLDQGVLDVVQPRDGQVRTSPGARRDEGNALVEGDQPVVDGQVLSAAWVSQRCRAGPN